MRKIIDSMAPSITTILVRGKRVSHLSESPHSTVQLTIGLSRDAAQDGVEILIDKPVAPSEVAKYMYDRQYKFHPLASAMQQEVLVAAANLISSQPALFDGILTVRIAWLIEGMQMMMQFTFVLFCWFQVL